MLDIAAELCFLVVQQTVSPKTSNRNPEVDFLSEDTEPQSRSARKLSNAGEEDVHYNALHGYSFIEFFTVFTALV